MWYIDRWLKNIWVEIMFGWTRAWADVVLSCYGFRCPSLLRLPFEIAAVRTGWFLGGGAVFSIVGVMMPMS